MEEMKKRVVALEASVAGLLEKDAESRSRIEVLEAICAQLVRRLCLESRDPFSEVRAFMARSEAALRYERYVSPHCTDPDCDPKDTLANMETVVRRIMAEAPAE